jgi:signal transduction histidine kinase
MAYVSHELRTPLAIARTELDVTLGDPRATVDELRAMAAVVREANVRSERLIEALLALAWSDAGVALEERVDLAAVARGAVVRLAPGWPVALELEAADVAGNAVLLEQLAGNLVENAVRHGSAEHPAVVRTGVDGRSAVLVVSSAGAPLRAEDVPGLFEPFRRLEAPGARTARASGPELDAPATRTAGASGLDPEAPAARGPGLGLAVVRAVAEAHGGSATGRARPEGGLEVRVALPRGDSEAQPNRPCNSPPTELGSTWWRAMNRLRSWSSARARTSSSRDEP